MVVLYSLGHLRVLSEIFPVSFRISSKIVTVLGTVISQKTPEIIYLVLVSRCLTNVL
jgi:hypothetical protein